MISLTVHLEVEPGRVEDFLDAMADNAAHARCEPGCRRFEVHRSLERAEVFVLWEVYDDLQALAAHHGSAHFHRWLERSAGGLIRSKHSLRCEVIDPVEA